MLKDLAEIRAKAGLPVDDAKPDLENLWLRKRQKLFFPRDRLKDCCRRQGRESANGRYDVAMEHIDEAFASLPANTSNSPYQ